MLENKVLSVMCYTWNRDSHGLYDYENTSAKSTALEINKNQNLVRFKNEIRVSSKLEKDEEELIQVQQNENGYFLKNNLQYELLPTESNINSLQNKYWLPVKSENISPSCNVSQDRAYNHYPILQVNDIIKLGRVKYTVTELALSREENAMDIDPIAVKKEVIQLVPKIEKKDKDRQKSDCKICLSNTEDENNWMVNLCNCSGSIADVHINCVKQWMATKISNKTNEKNTVFSYNIKAFNCEICKMPYPLKFEFDKQLHHLIDIKALNGNYMILESLNQTKDNSNYKSVHVVKLSQGEKIILGRGHDSDIRINDISVSRKHACIEFSDSSVILKDLFSKFGTLVLQHNDIKMTETPVFIQIGRTLGKFSVEKTNMKLFKIKKNVVEEKEQENKKEMKNTSCDVIFIDKNGNLHMNNNIIKPKFLFKVEKVENKNGNHD
jgi:hypothetical protein